VIASRRDILTAGALMAAAFSPQALAAEVGSRPDQGGLPPDVGRKFEPDGRVRTFSGNTIICHLGQQGPYFATFDRVLDIYRDIPRHYFARKLALLPPSSYHMTIIGGATDQGREGGAWPELIPKDAPIEKCNEIIAERLKEVRVNHPMPIKMVIDLERATNPVSIPLRPLNDQMARDLAVLRDRLAEAMKLRFKDHDHYQFHMTIAYQIAWFDADEQRAYQDARSQWFLKLVQACPVIELGAPEYCVFQDMFAFERRFFIGS
jgi:hypothetical protein